MFQFHQNQSLKKLLLDATGIFANATPGDTYWGIGCTSDIVMMQSRVSRGQAQTTWAIF